MSWLRSLRDSLAAERTGYAQTAVVLIVVGCALVLDAIAAGPFDEARTFGFAMYQKMLPPHRTGARTVVVEIDNESIRRFGQWPWPRDLLAALLTATQGASAVGFDVLMPDPDRFSPGDLISRLHITAPALRDALLALPQSDEALATALQKQPTVLAMTLDDDRPNAAVNLDPVRQQGDFDVGALVYSDRAVWPLPILAGAAGGVGIVSAPSGLAGEIELVPAAAEVRGTILPGFATELIRVARGSGSIVLKAPYGVPSAISIDALTFRVDPSGEVAIRRSWASDRGRRAPAAGSGSRAAGATWKDRRYRRERDRDWSDHSDSTGRARIQSGDPGGNH
ncbi:MAG TPA: CHASE2 domain-containing protein [Rhodopila sp.]